MSCKRNNCYLLLEIVICFFLLALILPLIYPLFTESRNQVEKWRTLRALQEQAELTFLELKEQLDSPKLQNIYPKLENTSFDLNPSSLKLTSPPDFLSLKKLKSTSEDEWIELTIEYQIQKRPRTLKISQIFCLKKSKFDMRK